MEIVALLLVGLAFALVFAKRSEDKMEDAIFRNDPIDVTTHGVGGIWWFLIAIVLVGLIFLAGVTANRDLLLPGESHAGTEQEQP